MGPSSMRSSGSQRAPMMHLFSRWGEICRLAVAHQNTRNIQRGGGWWAKRQGCGVGTCRQPFSALPSCPVSGAKDSDRIRAPSTSVHIQQPGGAHARPGELTIPSFFRSPTPPCDPPVTVDGLPLCDERDVASGGVVQQAREVGAQTSRLANSGAPRRPSSTFSWQCGAGEAQRVVEPRCHLREPCQRPRGAEERSKHFGQVRRAREGKVEGGASVAPLPYLPNFDKLRTQNSR